MHINARIPDPPTVSFRDEVSRDIPYAVASVELRVNVVVPATSPHAEVVERVNSALTHLHAGPWRLAPRAQRTDAALKWMEFEASSHLPLDHLHGLGKRAASVGGEGLTVSRPSVQFAVPQSERLAVMRSLVVDAYRSARRQAEAMSESGGCWEVHTVSCDVGHSGVDPDVALSQSSSSRLPADGDADEFVFGPPLCSQRVSMAVSVTLVQMSALPGSFSEA
jgi:hypothetical protein